jgi:hypothetical protein
MNRVLRHTREHMGNRYHLVRECVQAQKPFAIYNFTNSKQYNQFLYDLDSYGKLSYVLQTITSVDMSNRVRRVFPSVFVTNEETDINLDQFKEMVKGSIKHYNLDSIVCLYDGAVSVFYKNGEHHEIGSSLYASSSIQEFNSDFYQIEGIYYCFIR